MMLWHEQQGNGPDLLLIHGWGMHGGVWGDLPASLAQHFRVTTLDLPGHGRSDAPRAAQALGDFTDAVVEICPAPAVWLGWSLGALVALDAALRYPEKVTRLVLVGATPRFVQAPDWPHAMPAEVFAGFAHSLSHDYRATLLRFLILHVGSNADGRALLKQLRAKVFAPQGEPQPAALAAGLSILEQTDLRARLADIRVPALVVHGSHDRLAAPAAAEYLAAHLPQACLLRIEGAGHAPFLSHPAQFAQAVCAVAPGVSPPATLAHPGAAVAPAHPCARDTCPSLGGGGQVTDSVLPPLDKKSVRAAFARAAAHYDAAAILQREIAERLLARLDYMRIAPQRVLDLGCGTGYATGLLARRYPRARVLALDLAQAMTAAAQRRVAARWPFGLGRVFQLSPFDWLRAGSFVTGDAEALPFADNSIDLVFSNLALQWCDPDAVFRECRRVLKPGGLFLFSTFGPDTLKELRAAWRAVDADPHVHAFIDMHDLGDALVRARFADPVMDVEPLTLTYADVPGVLRDLKAIGAHNAAATRRATLTGKTHFTHFVQAYESFRRADGRLPASYETVYGHAWAPLRTPWPAGQAVVSLDHLRRGRR